MKNNVNILSLLVSLALASPCLAAVTYTDTAANYGGTGEPTFATGQNSNVGGVFGAWTLEGSGPDANSNPTSGHFLGDVARHGSNASLLDTSGQSFMMWASGFAGATRAFAGPLNNGDVLATSFSMQWDNGSRGFALRDLGNEVFFFSVGSGGFTWSGSGASAAIPWSTRENGIIVNASFTKTSSGFDYLFTSNAGGLNSSGSFATALAINEIRYFVSGAGGGAGGDFAFNNLALTVPEPSSSLLMGLGLAGLLALRKTRKA